MKYLISAATLFTSAALLGAGCLPSAQPETSPLPAEQPKQEVQTNTENMMGGDMMNTGESNTPSSDQTTGEGMMGEETTEGMTAEMTEHVDLAAIDDTWGSYTNRAGTFSFRYPTRGRYAPEWEVSYIAADDTNLSGDCYTGNGSSRGTQSTLSVNGTSFCHTKTDDPGAGQHYYSDYYLANVAGTRVLFTFTKHLVNGDMYDDVSCHGKIVLSVGDSFCAQFDEAIYEATLDQSMNTFTVAG